MEILEPHEYNARLLKEQKARGEEPNIPQINLPGHVFKTLTKAPKMTNPADALKGSRESANRNPQGLKLPVGEDAGLDNVGL
jgi:hypothetical protein